MGTYYKPPRMVLAGAGGIDHEALVKLANQHFTGKSNFDISVPQVNGCRFTGDLALLSSQAVAYVFQTSLSIPHLNTYKGRSDRKAQTFKC